MGKSFGKDIKKGDLVLILAGKHRGDYAEVTNVLDVTGHVRYYVRLSHGLVEMSCTRDMLSPIQLRTDDAIHEADLNERW